MSKSMQEEIVAALWVIAAVVAFGHGFVAWGWVFAIQGALAVTGSIWFAIRDILLAKKDNARDAGTDEKK